MNEPLTWIRDEAGYLGDPNVHDALMVEFSLTETVLYLRLRPVSGEHDFAFELRGISNANATIWSTPIVDHIVIADRELLIENVNARNIITDSLFKGQVSETKRSLELDRQLHRYPGYFIFYVACSYGGDIATMAKEIEILKLSR